MLSQKTYDWWTSIKCLNRFFNSNPNTGPCNICSKPGCCSATCQLKSAKSLPYNIHHEERCGRLLTAARDISAGEILFTDMQGAVGPRPVDKTEPICLTCYKKLPKLVYRCRHCSWPLCSSFCQQDDGPHARECQLFRKNRQR